jgi:hypothetical protein
MMTGIAFSLHGSTFGTYLNDVKTTLFNRARKGIAQKTRLEA